MSAEKSESVVETLELEKSLIESTIKKTLVQNAKMDIILLRNVRTYLSPEHLKAVGSLI